MKDQRASATRAVTTPAALDFDTRLMLRGIDMHVRLGRHSYVQEARQEAADAITDAERYSAECDGWQGLTRPQTASGVRVLSRAADLIRLRGWSKGNWTSKGGPVCAQLAIQLAAGGDQAEEASALNLMRKRIGGELIPDWNDRSERTMADVLRVMG